MIVLRAAARHLLPHSCPTLVPSAALVKAGQNSLAAIRTRLFVLSTEQGLDPFFKLDLHLWRCVHDHGYEFFEGAAFAAKLVKAAGLKDTNDSETKALPSSSPRPDQTKAGNTTLFYNSVLRAFASCVRQDDGQAPGFCYNNSSHPATHTLLAAQ